ncbi:hypothetical protein GIB67_010703 [Kingdonia uniflora]|uniref:Uncharacterized protein n=1 Tax=Kingdonia uniflora TaxID=39325 RepID=A0A7J7L8K9_9MAGN|nr:hypothetical protein GIB67_010703 [Kingdonia uniflora]
MSFNSLPPTQTLEISNDLSLIPRISLLLTIHRSDLSVKPFDEWQFKHSLINFLKNKTSLSISHTIPEDDINIHTYKDLKKRKRDEPVATGTLYIRDLEFLNEKTKRDMLVVGGDEEEVGVVEKRFLEWRKGFVEKVDGINLNLEGVKFRLNAVLNANDDFDGLKKSWEEFYAFGNRGE